jgi:hypothetical protein
MLSADFIRQGRPDTNQGAPSSTQTATSGAPSTDTNTNEHKRVQTNQIIIAPAPEGEATVVRKILERYPYHIACTTQLPYRDRTLARLCFHVSRLC